MTVTSAKYMVDGMVLAVNNGVQIFASAASADVAAWVAAGNTIAAYVAPTGRATCLLWQLEAACNAPPASLGFTPPTWAEIGTVIAGMNAAVKAFFAQGLNPIPANSVTLLSIAAATTPALTAEQVTALVSAAAAISID